MLVKIAPRLDCRVTYLLAEDAGGQAALISPAILVTPDGVELVELSGRISCAPSRKALLNLARALANSTKRRQRFSLP